MRSNELRACTVRYRIFVGLVVGSFALLGLRLADLQILNRDLYAAVARDNAIRAIRSPAPRGRIDDRSGRLLVNNETASAVTVTPYRLGDDVGRRADLLGLPDSTVEARVDEVRRWSLCRPTVVAAHLRPAIAARVLEEAYRLPGVEVVDAYHRTYPPGPRAAHALGTLAPGGYASLLVRDGRATLSAWLFDPADLARKPGTYLDLTLKAVRQVTARDVRAPRRSGGIASFSVAPPWTRNRRLRFVGERAGFQDALWGLGLRHALLSGVLAARAIVMGEDYDALCREFLVPGLEVALANRVLLGQLPPERYEAALGRAASGNAVATLRRLYHPTRTTAVLHEPARFGPHPSLAEPACHGNDCRCLWCEHGPDAAEADDLGAHLEPAAP